MRLTSRLLLLLLAAAALGAGGWAAASLRGAEGPLEGRFFTGGPIEEGDLGPGESHYYVWLEGASARALYERLPGEPEPSVCEDGSAWTRSNGGSVVCTASADSTRYACYFALDVAADSLAPGVTC